MKARTIRTYETLMMRAHTLNTDLAKMINEPERIVPNPAKSILPHYVQSSRPEDAETGQYLG